MRISEYLQIGEKLKNARKESGINQRQMSKQLNLTPSTYSNYENGYSEPPMEIIQSFCSIVGITLEQFFGFPVSDADRHTSVSTFSDLISILIDLDKRGLHITNAVHYLDGPDNQLHAAVTLDFENAQLATFIPDWRKKNEDLKNGIIDEEEYTIWLEDTMRIFNVPIDEYIYR